MDTRLRRITVDLTPVLPGGDNGGAKLVARSLVRELSTLTPDTNFTLLTSAVSHTELANLDAPNVQRQCVDADLAPINVDHGVLGASRLAARTVVNTLIPAGARSRVKDGVWTLIKRQRRAQVTRATLADLHFSPFTAPFFFDPHVPQVGIVYDLQFLDHPQFFDEETRADRHRHFVDACERADRLICISDFVRESVLAHAQVQPQHVRTIHLTLLHATSVVPHAESSAAEILAPLGLRSSRYLLYPANAWPHKNHRALVEAFAAYLSTRPDSDLALVCTGAPSAAFAQLRLIADHALPPGRFAFTGFVSERDFSRLLSNCRALIFPSLYEGFGMPVLEAMAYERPVLCSNVSSLPEIAGDAALPFNPYEPSSITSAIERLESEPALEATLVQRGRQRVAYFGSARDMAAKYLAIFEDVVSARRRSGAAAR